MTPLSRELVGKFRDCQVVSGGVLHPIGPKPHSCKPPGWFTRLRYWIRAGQLWDCPCGQRWIAQEIQVFFYAGNWLMADYGKDSK